MHLTGRQTVGRLSFSLGHSTMYISYITFFSPPTKNTSPGKIQCSDVATNGSFWARAWGDVPTAVAIRQNLVQMVPRKMCSLNSLPVRFSLFPEFLNLHQRVQMLPVTVNALTDVSKHISKPMHWNSQWGRNAKLKPHNSSDYALKKKLRQLS